MKCWIFAATLLFPILRVDATATISVQFFDYRNPNGKGANGHYCDGKFFVRGSDCDHRFIVCLDQQYGSRSVWHCPYGRRNTGYIRNSNHMSFGRSIGGTANPMLFTVNQWPGSVRIKIDVWDHDDNNDDFVDFLQVVHSSTPSYNVTSASTPPLRLLTHRTRLRLRIKVYCNPNYYGRDCATFCAPRDDAFGHYICDWRTGRKTCLKGWQGMNCMSKVDNCLSSPCMHGATCHSNHDNFRCDCADGFVGERCQVDVNECVPNPCENNGTCVDMVNGFQCKCPKGYSGNTCTTNIDDCHSNPCSNNGTCVDDIGRFQCSCPTGWTGPTCSDNVDECLTSPCKGNSTCIDTPGDLCDQKVETEALHGTSGNSSPVAANSQKGWVASHWYVVLAIAVACLLLGGVIAILFVRRKRNMSSALNSRQRSKGSYFDDSFTPISFENSLYAETQGGDFPEGTRLNINYTYED